MKKLFYARITIFIGLLSSIYMMFYLWHAIEYYPTAMIFMVPLSLIFPIIFLILLIISLFKKYTKEFI
jgi:hypothetical protein